MTVLITLPIAGPSTGPFSLYSNVDGYTTPFEIQVPKPLLVAGYTSVSVPAGTTIIQVRSLGTCTNSINLPINLLGTSTTTTSTSTTTAPTTTTTTVPTTTTSSTSTSTTTVPTTTSTTTTTTTFPPLQLCIEYEVSGANTFVNWTDCDGNPQSYELTELQIYIFCALEGTVTAPGAIIYPGGPCGGEITTTTTTTTTPPPANNYSFFRCSGSGIANVVVSEASLINAGMPSGTILNGLYTIEITGSGNVGSCYSFDNMTSASLTGPSVASFNQCECFEPA